MSIAGYYFGTRLAKIATWNGIETYGTPVTLAGIEMTNVTLETISGELKGNDRILDIHAKVIKVTGKIKIAFSDLESIAILSGETVVDSTPNSKSMVFGESDRPYFALAFKVLQTNGTGDFQGFLPMCKIVGPMPLAFGYGAYVTPEMTFTAVYESAVYGAFKAIEHSTAGTLNLPIT